MKYLLIILAFFSVCFSCKTKKNVTQNTPPVADSFYRTSPNSSAIELIVNEGKTDPTGIWLLQDIDGKHDNEMQQLTLELKPKAKSFSGFDGCNSYMGELKNYNGRHIEFTEMAVTERVCIRPAKYAQALYKVLKQVRVFCVHEDVLLFNDANGSTRLQFMRKE